MKIPYELCCVGTEEAVVIREERPGDEAAIFALNAAAFESDAEARLVDALRACGALSCALVAARGEQIIGHIAFSPVTITDSAGGVVSGVGLAPMAVAPGAQRGGVGSRLVREGLRRLGEGGHRLCVVLGHPGYYPRFGFERASLYGMRWEVEAPDEAFMVAALTPSGIGAVSGVVRYRAEFEGV